jgi:hypothetical protein
LPKSRPFAYNSSGTSSRVAGTLQFGTMTIGGTASSSTYQSGTGLQWWNGPDEDIGYAIIAKTVPSATQPTPVVGPNEILDPTLSGAGGGSLPTGWTANATPAGITISYGAVQTAGGISYFDISVTGTRTSGTGAFTITTTSDLDASQGQTWGARYWIAGVTGSIPGLTIQTLELQNNTTLGTSNFGIIPTSELKLYVGSRTLTNPSTNRVRSRISFSLLNNVPVSFTLRVGSPIFGLQQLASVGFNRATNQAQFLQMSAQLSSSNPATEDAAVRALNANSCWTNYNPAITSNLILSLDAGNAASYSGSGTEWWNLVSSQGGSLKADLFSSPSWSDDSGAFNFDGITQYAQTPSNVTSSQWSVEAWFKTGASLVGKETSIVSSLVANGNVAFSLGNYDSGENFLDISFYKNGSWFTSVNRITPTIGVIYQLVGTYDGSDLSFYQNGTLLGSNSLPGSPTFDSPVTIARSGNPGDGSEFYFKGSVYIIRIYSSALNSGDVSKNWNANRGRFSL